MKISRRIALALMASTALTPALARAESHLPAVEDMMMGTPAAAVTVIEYASYTCPHCASFHRNVWPSLKENYIDTGKINFIYREVYFDRYGLWAGMMARCGGGEKYFGITDMLYKQQRDWIDRENPEATVNNLKTIGKIAGIDEADLDACFQDGAKAEALVAEFKKNAEADAVDSTPTLIVNGTKYSNMAYGDLAAIIDAELES